MKFKEFEKRHVKLEKRYIIEATVVNRISPLLKRKFRKKGGEKTT